MNVTDYDPLTPMDGGNVNGHILFGMNGRSVVTTSATARCSLKDRKLLVADEKAVMQACRESSARLWQTINAETPPSRHYAKKKPLQAQPPNRQQHDKI